MPRHERRFEVSPEAYPFNDRWFDREGTAMHYVDEGDGLPVLMLHGDPTWSFLYRDIIKTAKESCRRIAPDHPGFGFSGHPPSYGYTHQEPSEWIAARGPPSAFLRPPRILPKSWPRPDGVKWQMQYDDG